MQLFRRGRNHLDCDHVGDSGGNLPDHGRFFGDPLGRRIGIRLSAHPFIAACAYPKEAGRPTFCVVRVPWGRSAWVRGSVNRLRRWLVHNGNVDSAESEPPGHEFRLGEPHNPIEPAIAAQPERGEKCGLTGLKSIASGFGFRVRSRPAAVGATGGFFCGRESHSLFQRSPAGGNRRKAQSVDHLRLHRAAARAASIPSKEISERLARRAAPQNPLFAYTGNDVPPCPPRRAAREVNGSNGEERAKTMPLIRGL